MEGFLENAIEDGTDSAGGLGDGVGLLHLSQNFSFADHLGIEPGGHFEEMDHGGGVDALVSVGCEINRIKSLDAAELGEEALAGDGLGAHRVEFDAVAGIEQAVLGDDPGGAQRGGERGAFFRGEREALAQGERRGAMVRPEQEKLCGHGALTAAGAAGRGGVLTIPSESSGARNRARQSQANRCATQRWRRRCTRATA